MTIVPVALWWLLASLKPTQISNAPGSKVFVYGKVQGAELIGMDVAEEAPNLPPSWRVSASYASPAATLAMYS